ncbi:MAG: peptidoglycan-associated lipoprotein Pal [Paracoccaceae bacterium]
MKLKLAGLMMAALLGLTACAKPVPDGARDAGEFKYETPEYFNATVGDRVLFAVDQSKLSPEAAAILDGQAEWLLKNNGFSVLIEGHADEQGTREYNLALGARRASAVQAYLVSKGVPDARISTVTYGKERPIEICSNESCWSRNRRAVTVVSAPTG